MHRAPRRTIFLVLIYHYREARVPDSTHMFGVRNIFWNGLMYFFRRVHGLGPFVFVVWDKVIEKGAL